MFSHNKYALSKCPEEKSVRDVIKDESGRELVILRICYPSVPQPKHIGKSAPSPKRFNDFYEQAARGFEAFARQELLAKAKQNPAGTPPCGAVLRWSLTEETKETLTLCVEGSVFDGTDTHPISKDVRCWDRQSGLLKK